MYASIDTALPFSVALILFCVFERVLHAITSLFFPSRSLASSKDFASYQFIISVLDFVISVGSSIVYTFFSLVSAAISSMFWVSAILIVGSVLYVTYEEAPWVWTDMARGYNAFLGPFFQDTVVATLDIFNVVFKSVIPLWNALVFFVMRILTGFLWPTVLGNFSVFQSIGSSLFDFVKHLVFALSGFVQTVVVDCPAIHGDACFDLTNRTLDLMTPMADAKQAVSHLVVLTRSICQSADPVVDIVSYPFMDINFASFVHNTVNALLYLTVQMPEITSLRCARFGQSQPLLCTPDMDPFYAFLVAGIKSLGSLLDNWIDIIYVVVQGVLGWAQISCSASMIPSTIDPGPVRSSVFNDNQTVIVGLTGYLLAVTDGSIIVYEGNGKLRISSWASDVDISYGVAAVTYGGSSDSDVSSLSIGDGTSTSLLGCSCYQDPVAGMRLQCQIMPYGGLLANESGVVPVFFQQGGTGQKGMSCLSVDVIVQSVRWPATRFSGGTTGSAGANLNCATSNTCNNVDATVWVIPRTGCDQESALCDCFPFCMAARLSGSQASPLVMYSATQWRSNVYLTQRDCVLHTVTSTFSGTVSTGIGVAGVSAVQASASNGPQFVSTQSQTISCTDNLLVTTVINRALHPVYEAPTTAFLRNPSAPFAVTGDTILTAIKHGDGSYTVRVERLTGATGNEFTLSVVTNNFPAIPPPNVPSLLFSEYPKDSLTIPYSRLATLSVSSSNYVFFAVNPSIEVFSAYLRYCQYTGDDIAQFGIILESSYSPIRIWRVEAYQRCSVAGCGPNLVAQADIPDAFSDGTFNGTSLESDCERSYNDIITQLEYVDEVNIAVTVRFTDVNASFVQYRTYWLNINTMQLNGPGLANQGPWTDEVPATALSAYSLCPSMQILPELGSFLTQIFVAGVFLIRMPLDAVLYTAGIVNLWSNGPACPLQTHGHSILQQCGANAFSLNDFFDALQQATDIFWSIPTYAADLVGGLASEGGEQSASSSEATGFVQDTLNGIARYGAGSIDLWTVRFQVLGMMKAAPSIVMNSMPSSDFFNNMPGFGDMPDSSTMSASAVTGMTQGAGWAQSAVKVGSNALGWARFGYSAMLKIVVTIVKSVVSNQPVSASKAWRIAVNTLDEVRDDYDTYVVDNMRQACGGLALMNGVNNPWAVFMYQQCLANVAVVESGVTVLLSVFNLSPFAQCMCSGSAGKRFADYAMQNCLPQASTTLRPVLLQMIQAASGPVPVGSSPAQDLCWNMINFTNASLNGAVQPWFDAQYASLDALAASVDYALFWLDPAAGECEDFSADPDVVVIMPYPADYFDSCAETTVCRNKCSGLWGAFDAALAAATSSAASEQVTVQVESLFFPSLSADAFTPMLILTLMQPTASTCYRVCGHSGDLCVAIAGITGSGNVAVQYYCVPLMMTAAVYRTLDKSLEWSMQSSALWNEAITQLQFADGDGQILVALVGTDSLYIGNVYGTVQLANVTSQSADLELQVLQLSAVMVVYNRPYACVVLNLIYRLVTGQITSQPFQQTLVVNTLEFDPRLNGAGVGVWNPLGASQFFAQIQGYQATQVSTSASSSTVQFLLLPESRSTSALLWDVQWDSSDVTNGVSGTLSPYLLGTPSGLGSLLSSGQVVSQNCAVDSEGAYITFAAAPSYQSTSWLTQLRISGVSAGSYGSQPVYVSVSTAWQCDVSSCIGCPDGEVQSLCDAVQQCAVVNCIGTVVNMRRPLCQVGQTLADYARQNLALMSGTWEVFVEIYLTLMDLSLQKGITGITLSFPDDRFFGYVCSMKDNNVHMISVLTSALNGMIQFGHSSVLYLEGGAHEIDTNFNALTTMPLTAFTSFLNQWFMGPLYALIVAHQVAMCRVNGVLAIFDATGFTVSIGSAPLESATSSLVGQCLTQNFVVKSNNPTDSSNTDSVARIVSQVSQSATLALLPQLTFQGSTLETLMHVADGTISYYIGLLYGMADMLDSLDITHCKLPNYFLNETVFCACGDTPFAIPAARRSEGLQGVGLWCTGTLSMLDASNQPFVIYNPYTYEQLQQLAEGSDAYLACMSSKAYVAGNAATDCQSLQPPAPLLQQQGVSVLTVLTACKRNYVNMQWDQAAYVLFNSTLFNTVVQGFVAPDLSKYPPVLQKVGQCLSSPSSRPTCLQDYLTYLGVDPMVYWVYEDGPAGPSQLIDACQVFTGPANSTALSSNQRSVFRACLDQYNDSNCQLSSNLWTAQSANAVPVAYMHGVRLSGGAQLDQIVQLKYQEANDLVMSALQSLQNYSNSDVLAIFFSPEGDIMHQMLDCVFLGPYDSVNYWPVDSNGILSVPVWYRDLNGSSRDVDPSTCVRGAIDQNPPYSCGSPSRQAVIKYFFRDYLQSSQNKNSTLRSIIRDLVQGLSQAWNDTDMYPCLCADMRTHSVECCSQNASTVGVGAWLPPELSTDSQTVPSNSILRALTNQVEAFYRVALENPVVWKKYLDKETLNSYNWSNPVQSAVSTREALFRTDVPSIMYDSSEVNSPLLFTGLWDQCHGLLSKIFFTIPMQGSPGGQWTPQNLPSGSVDSLDALAAFVRAAVQGAYTTSPLYRHYNVSYVPSDSRLCRPVSPSESSFVSNPSKMSVAVGSFEMGSGTVQMDTSGWGVLPSFGVDAFPVHGCFCGWDGNGSFCLPPVEVANAIPEIAHGFPGQSRDIIALIKSRWVQGWPCPALQLGDQYGVMDSSEYNDWLTGVQRDYKISGMDLLRRGRSGLRVGSFATLSSSLNQTVSPTDRLLEPGDVTIPYCASEFGRLSGSPLLDADMHQAFVSQLFPVAQGVYESGTASYCLRYMIEAALLETLMMVSEQVSNASVQIGLEIALQQKAVNLWRVRCDSQITLLSLCKNMDVFQVPQNRKKRFYKCPFSIAAKSYNDIYMTPGCLVHSSGLFYDPCNCPGFVCGPGLPVFNVFTPECQIPFDPRNFSVNTPLGGWKVRFPTEVLVPTFVDEMMGAGSALGNVPRGGSWVSDEGFLNSTGLHCDMLTDWWPDGQTLPVGYHATIPCSSDDTGYQTFDSAFAVQRTGAPDGQYTVVRMVYQHDITRDASMVDTQLGAGGLCRASTLGMPLYQSNVMRICTRQLVTKNGTDSLDPSIPVQLYDELPDSEFAQEACSTSSSDTPWFNILGNQDSAFYSVGTVPNMPQPSVDTTYPPQDLYFGLGPKASIQKDVDAGGTGWGDGCSDFSLKGCSSDSDCPLDYYCLLDAGVCMSDDFLSADFCYRHDMCLDGQMCDGTGKCSDGYLVFMNTLSSSMEAQVFSEQCDETSSFPYFTDGSSPWEYVPDWLQGHGMCSNKNWYLYSLNVLALKQSGAQCTASECPVNARKASLPLNSSLWWPSASPQPKLFSVLPTVCDRDYEHMSGLSGMPMTGCSPKNTRAQDNQIVTPSLQQLPLEYAGLFRNYDGFETQIAKLPFVGSLNKTGFLGVAPTNLTSAAGSPYIFNCEIYQNCHAYTFTVNGAPVQQRVYRKNGVLYNYDNDDIFRCGVMSYFDSSISQCVLDSEVLGLYEALCNTPSVIQTCSCLVVPNDPIGCKPVIDESKRSSICLQINQVYSASYTMIQSNNNNLQSLFGVFIQSDGSLQSQVSGVECFNAIYNSLQTLRAYSADPVAGVYYPFNFALYELPLAWVYQCIYVGGIGISASASRIQCNQFEKAQTVSVSESNVQTNYFNFDLIQGGYNRAEVIAGINNFTQHVLSALPDPASIAEAQTICKNTFQLTQAQPCQMVSYCASSQVWKKNSEMTSLVRDFLVGYAHATSCQDDSMQYALIASGMSFAQFTSNWTDLKDFTLDSTMSNIGSESFPSIQTLLSLSLEGCIRQPTYVKSQLWPLQFSFDQSLSACMAYDAVLTQTALNLPPGSDINSAYTPNQNYGSVVPVNIAPYECIFPDLADQVQSYDPDMVVENCVFATQTCSTPCFKYSQIFTQGQQACQYPVSKNFTNFVTKDLLTYLWGKLQTTFNNTYNALPPFPPPVPVTQEFFASSQAFFQGWVFDASGVQNYLSNINPDTSKEVMCVVTPASQTVNFTSCNDANFAALEAFTESQRQQAAPIVPSESQLRWKVSQQFLARGAILAFANHTRPAEQVYLSNVFDTEKRCGLGELPSNRVCLAETVGAEASKVRPWVPWMSGQWNPYEYCDVKLLDLDNGNQEVIWPYDIATCPQCSALGGQYRSSFMYDALTPSCDSRQMTFAKQTDVDQAAVTNLCYIQMTNTDTTCTHEQGMLGGGRGRTVLNEPQMPYLYGTNNLTVPEASSGIFPRSPNSLLNGVDAAPGEYGYISVPGDELGVTTVGLSIDPVPNSLPYLRVSRLPLQADTGFLSQMASNDVSTGWVSSLASAYATENAIYAKEESSRGNSAWDCPMRRASFYSQVVGEPFVTNLPNQGRSRRIFSQLTQGLAAHPTVMLQRNGSALGQYSTSNGFCYCPANMSSDQSSCRISLEDSTHNCSLKRTIDALRGAWIQSFVFSPTSAGGGDATCRMQFDWPYVGGTLRDGTSYEGSYNYASDPLKRRCHLLDRLKPFLYRYEPRGVPSAVPGTSTLNQGGVCHTGRAAQVNSATQAKLNAQISSVRCVKTNESSTLIYVSCEDGTSMVLTKEASTPLPDMVAAVQSSRASCSQCSPPPTFVNSEGTTIQPESSFGIPFRFSAERAVAADLRRMLCPEGECDIPFNESAWTNGQFLSTLLSKPSSLFIGLDAVPMNGSFSPPVDSAWDSEWVYCNTTSELKAGTCKGGISESDWRSNRFQSCYRTIGAMTQNSPDVMSSIDVCLIDSKLSALCTAVQQAQALVSEANCLASGSPECILKPYLYVPGTWDVSNREFVRQTVANFYSRVTTAACPLTDAVVIANNQAILNRCASNSVAVMYLALQGCRDIVDTFAQVVFYGVNILIGAFQMAFSTNQDALKAQIVYYWESLTSAAEGLVTTLSDIFFDMLFHMGKLGGKIYSFIQSACKFFNLAYAYWLKTWCGISIDLAPMALLGIRHVAEYCEVAFKVLNDCLNVIFRYLVPQALQDIESEGYTKSQSFREEDQKEQDQEKQTIHDSLVSSHDESKSADQSASKAKSSVLGKYGSVLSGSSGFIEAAALTAASSALGDAGRFAMVADFAVQAYQTAETVILTGLLPSNWTLFDFSSVYVAIDTFEYFISSDQQCLNYQASGVTEIMSCDFPSLSSYDASEGTLMVATRCWADAQQDVGTSNLLSCTDSDTCYQSLDDSSAVVCVSCPNPAPGYSPYGCSPVTQMCTCGVPSTQPDSCTSNEECYYATSTCILVAGLDMMSYGNQPCTQCSRQVECIIRDSSGVGQCGCVFQSQPIQQCSQNPGQRVDITAPNQMCGYLANANPSQSLVSAHWDSLALTQCMYLTPSAVYCVQVYQGSSISSMAVGINMASLTASFQSRRLLANGQILPEDSTFELHNAESEYALPNTEAMHYLLMEDWNSTAAPCSALVWTYQQAARSGNREDLALGPLDTMYLHKCAYWRQVGRETIAVYNLTSLRSRDGFLLSLDDFASALAQKSVIVELVQKPAALLFAMGRAPLLKPLYAAMVTARSMYLSLSFASAMLPGGDDGLNASFHHPKYGHSRNSESPPHGHRGSNHRGARKRHRGWRHEAVNHSMMEEWLEDWRRVPLHDLWWSAWKQVSRLNGVPNTTKPRVSRKLLQDTDIQVAQSWLTGPFTWPPTYSGSLSVQQCSAGTALVQIFHDILQVLVPFYYNTYPKPPTPPRSLLQNLPNLSAASVSDMHYDSVVSDEGWISYTYHGVWSIIGLDTAYVRNFFSSSQGTTNVFTLSTSMLQCDFTAVTFCSNHRKDIFASAVLLFILYMIVAYIGRILGVPIMGTLLLLFFVPILIWYAYGMAFTCGPMIPTCLMDNVISWFNILFPAQITIPTELSVADGCLANPAYSACFRPCTDAPMLFLGWRDTFAYGLCSLSTDWCQSLANLIGQRDALSSSLYAKAQVVSTGGDSLIGSMDFCFGVTFVNLIPPVILIVVVLSSSVYLLYLPCTVLPRFLTMAAQSVFYTHSVSSASE